MFELTEQDVFRLVQMFGSSDMAFMHVKVGDIEVILSRSDHDGPPPMGEGAGGRPQAAARPAAAVEPVDGRPASGAAAAVSSVEPAASPTKGVVAPDPAPGPRDLVTVTAPTLGTFYSASRPDLPPYVEVGSVVEAETTVGLIEAMKVFTGVSAGVDGSVVEILVGNNDFVEYGQPLFRVKPTTSEGGQAR